MVEVGEAVRQGDPLAPTLFSLLTDFLIHKLKEGGSITGLQDLEGEDKILSIFADDNFLMLLAEEENVSRAMEIMNESDGFLAVRSARKSQE